MPAPLKKAAGQLKVLTFNVNWGGVDMPRSAAAIARSHADVVALQETTPAWQRFLQKRFKADYPHQRYFHGPGAGGMAFLSRHPLGALKRIAPPRGGWFPGWLVRIKTPVGVVRMLNVHLRPPLKAGGGVSSVASAYLTTRSIRVRQLKKYLAAVPRKPVHPLIVLGDFNESDSGRALGWAKRKGLKSALARYDSKTPTWRWPTSVYTFTSRLDHILHSKQLRCLGAQVLGDAASDHRPVEAVFARSIP
jgi:endonuclease/exonuclease/phosphatase (EEP) superfamily protein YafD